MVEKLGIIGGASLLDISCFADFKLCIIETVHGKVKYYIRRDERIVFIQRHQADPEIAYAVPHLINYKAICAALLQLSIKRVICFSCVGSLKTDLHVGEICIPDDFFDACPTGMSYYEEKRSHFVPNINTPMRNELINLLKSNHIHIRNGGVYVQTKGPRIETKAEIRWLRNLGDIVGMTAVNESTLLQETHRDFAILAVVDNVANGLEHQEGVLTIELFHTNVQQNRLLIDKMFTIIVEHLAPIA